MNTIIENKEKELIIKKSKFIGIALEIDSKESADKFIIEYREKYKDATHCCYAYITDAHEKMSDDGEPSGTAGMPILELLKKKNLNNVLILVIRYFGGIKLGASGLIHAYVDTAKEVLNNNICEEIDGYKIAIEFDYSLQKEIDYILKNIKIINKIFDNKIIYEFECDNRILELISSYNIKIKNKINKKIKASR